VENNVESVEILDFSAESTQSAIFLGFQKPGPKGPTLAMNRYQCPLLAQARNHGHSFVYDAYSFGMLSFLPKDFHRITKNMEGQS